MFAIRHAKRVCRCGEFAQPDGMLRGTGIAKAATFAELEAAKTFCATLITPEYFDIVQITYGLRWYETDGKPHTTVCYRTATSKHDPRRNTSHRKDAARFESPAAAKASANPYFLKGSNGPDDKCGYRVVRFTKVVA